MKIKLKDKPIRRGNTYGGFGVKIATALNSGDVVEIEQIPEVSKDLVEFVKFPSLKKEALEDVSEKEINNGS